MPTLSTLMLLLLPLNGQAQLPTDNQPSELKRYEFENDGSGTYNYNFETVKNGKTDIVQTAKGYPLPESSGGGHDVTGAYYYKLQPSGFVRVTYVADENGYRPKVTWSVVGDGDQAVTKGPQGRVKPPIRPPYPVPVTTPPPSTRPPPTTVSPIRPISGDALASLANFGG